MKYLLTLLAALAFAGNAQAQPAGQLAPGQVWGNATGTPGIAAPSSMSSMLDRGICGSDGALVRVSGTWSCVATLPATSMPALTGAVTSSAGSTATTLSDNVVTNANVATGAFPKITGVGTLTSGELDGLSVINLPAPMNASDAARLQDLDSVASGLHNIGPARLATATALTDTPTYDNGTAGVGATLTSTGNAALSVDGTAVVANDIILVKDQTSTTGCTGTPVAGCQNGKYFVSAAGAGGGGGAQWVLTRCTVAACGQAFNNAATMTAGAYVAVTAGTANIGRSYNLQATVSMVGQDAVTWLLFFGDGAGVTSLGGMTGALTCASSLSCMGTTIGIATLGVTTALINDLAVTTGKINDLAVTTGKINDLAVTNAKIAASTIDLTAKVTGTLPVANGGTGTSTAFTACSVVFAGAAGAYTQDNGNFCYDTATHSLRVGSAAASAPLIVTNGSGRAVTVVSATTSPSISLVDGAGTPNRMLIGMGAGTISDGCFFIYDERQSLIRLQICPDGTVALPSLASSAGGIGCLDASGFVTAAVKGTWMPELHPFSGSIVVTYATQIGSYWKCGRYVFSSFELATSNFDQNGATGQMTIAGLPFAADTDYMGVINGQGYVKAGRTSFACVTSNGGTSFAMEASGSGVGLASMQVTDFPNTAALAGILLKCSVGYFTP